MTRTNKPYVEYYFVGTDDQDVKATGNIKAAGNAANILNGQLGVICGLTKGAEVWGNFMAAGDDIADMDHIQIVQGTENSADTSNLYGWHYSAPAFVASGVIRANTIQAVSSNVPDIATNSAVLYTDFETPENDTRYAVNLRLRSVRKDRDYGANIDQWTVDFTTGDISAVTDKVDHVLQNLAYKINLQSKLFGNLDPQFWGPKKEIVALALDLDGAGAGAAIGTLQVGDTVNAFVHNGTTYAITITKELLQTLFTWIDGSADISATTEIVVVDPDTAANADALILMGLTHGLAQVHDDIYATHVVVEATWANTLTPTEEVVSYATEDHGSGRLHKINWEARAFAQFGNDALSGWSDTLLLPVEYIDESLRYTEYIIEIGDVDVINNDHIHNQMRVHILLEAEDDASTATAADGLTVTTADTTTVTALNNILGVWLESNTKPFTYNGGAVVGTIFE